MVIMRKRIDGKLWYYEESFKYKTTAKRLAKNLRTGNRKARVIKEGKWWVVYTR